MIRFLHRWYHRLVHNVDPARDETERARDIERSRERAVLFRLALDSMDSEDPVKKKRGAELYQCLVQLDMARIFNKLRRMRL